MTKIGDDCREQLKRLKHQFADCVQQQSVEGATAVVRDTWDALSKDAHQRGVDDFPPLFASMQSTLCSIAGLFIVVEGHARFRERIGKRSGGNFFLSGVTGVGKSTLMRGIAAIIQSLSDHVFPVFCDLTTSCEMVRPLNLILDAHNRRWPDDQIVMTSDAICELAGEMSERRHYAALFIDELDLAYTACKALRSWLTCCSLARRRTISPWSLARLQASLTSHLAEIPLLPAFQTSTTRCS